MLTRQLQDEISDLSSQLRAEREARALQEGLYKEQLRLFRELEGESSRAREQGEEMEGQLKVAEAGRQGLAEQVERLQRENTQLQVGS